MPRDQRDSGSPEKWFLYAKADLELARIPLPKGAMYEQLCFHAQQAAEKAFKAVLLKLDIDYPPTHNIQGLVDCLPRKYITLPALVAATRLTPYAAAFRYPGEEERVSKKEYKEAIRIAEDIIEWAEGILGD
jgi:HEPN domain-containing protein